MSNDHEGAALPGGSVNVVVKIGDTVRRPTGPWTPAVHALLRHLEAAGFDGAPRVLGMDEAGREILSYVPGTAATRPWPAALTTIDGLAALARLIRRMHDALASFQPPADAVWRVPAEATTQAAFVCHGDLGPWNTIWRDNTPVAIIDWDFAEPGSPLDDVAQAAWNSIPLRPAAIWQQAGFGVEPDVRQRLHAFCDAYGGLRPSDVLDALSRIQSRERSRLLSYGQAGMTPWKLFLDRGDVARIDSDRQWLALELSRLI